MNSSQPCKSANKSRASLSILQMRDARPGESSDDWPGGRQLVKTQGHSCLSWSSFQQTLGQGSLSGEGDQRASLIPSTCADLVISHAAGFAPSTSGFSEKTALGQKPVQLRAPKQQLQGWEECWFLEGRDRICLVTWGRGVASSA